MCPTWTAASCVCPSRRRADCLACLASCNTRLYAARSRHMLDSGAVHWPSPRASATAAAQVVTPGYVRIVKGEGMPKSKQPGQKGDLRIVFDVQVRGCVRHAPVACKLLFPWFPFCDLKLRKFCCFLRSSRRSS